MSVTSISIPNEERRPNRQAITYEKGDNFTPGKGNSHPEIQRMESDFSVTYLDTLPENVQTKIKERNLVINNSNQDKPTRHLKQIRSSNQL